MAKLYTIEARLSMRLYDVEAESAYDAVLQALEEDNCEYSIIDYNVLSEEEVEDEEDD